MILGIQVIHPFLQWKSNSIFPRDTWLCFSVRALRGPIQEEEEEQQQLGLLSR